MTLARGSDARKAAAPATLNFHPECRFPQRESLNLALHPADVILNNPQPPVTTRSANICARGRPCRSMRARTCSSPRVRRSERGRGLRFVPMEG